MQACIINPCRLVLCELGELVKEVNGSVPSIAALSQALTDSTKALMGLGHIREAACISRQHVSFLRFVQLVK